MKKLFPEKKLFNRKGLLEFLDKKGFYVVLILCIAVVGVTAIIVTARNIALSNQQLESDDLVIDGLEDGFSVGVDDLITDIGDPIETEDSIPKETVSPEVASGESKAAIEPEEETTGVMGATTAPDNTPVPKENKDKKTSTGSGSTADIQKFTLPVLGGVTFEYAMDRLVYSKTLEDWRVHSGVDLAADRGTLVKAVADGVVSEVKDDPRFGFMIIIDHQNGLKSVYANLASDGTVTPNQVIKQGEVIGSVGDTALFESAEQTHLHFEVWKDGNVVDPTEYLPLTDKK